MNAFFTILAALLLIFIVWQARTVLPRIVSFLLPVKRHLYFEDDLQKPAEAAKRETLRPVIEKLESLGFKPLGMMVEKFPLWAGTSREITMVSPVVKTIASLGFRRRKPSYFFYTPFTGGEVVITSYNSFRDFTKDDFVTTVVPSGEPSEMLEIHQKQVEKFMALGYTPFTDYTRDSVITATRLYYDSLYPKQQLRIAGLFNLLFFIVCLFLLAILIRSAMG
ncbi:MAG TPA: hypothetical protein VF318_08985 [Dehalococcoidales bacterium]